MDRFTRTDVDTEVIATMLGCKPSHGLANTLNALQERGIIVRGVSTFGDVFRAVLVDMLAEHDRRAVRAA